MSHVGEGPLVSGGKKSPPKMSIIFWMDPLKSISDDSDPVSYLKVMTNNYDG